jgi:glycosyltransferase involved in cell wall biosynthesis
MRPISVLFTNNALAARAGTETYVRDAALALLRRGHRVLAFSLVLGDVADELRRATVPVVDDLSRVGEPPDVIHGHHHVEALIAALAFPGVPIVNFCHGWVPWEEMPLLHPAVRRYVAVDEVCVDRLVRDEGIPSERVDLLLNFVDLERFRPRPPLPLRPARALVLSNAATPGNYASAIASACRAAGIAAEVVGLSAGNATATPESLLPSYDLVFAKGRTALEAVATGCAVVLADAAGAGPLVTSGNYGALRARNFGIRELTRPHDPAWYATQIARYAAADAAAVSARVRAEAGIDPAIDRLLDIYAAAMAAPPVSGDASRAAARHCSRIARRLKQVNGDAYRAHALAGELQRARDELAAQSHDARAEAARLAGVLRESARLERELAAAREALAERERHLAAYRVLPTLRLRDSIVKTPIVGPVIQAGARRVAKLLS